MKTVAIDAELVEYVVAEVIRRLRDQGALIASNAASGGDLVLDDHVVSLARLNGKLAGVRRVMVKPRAIVTPSVKDELREKGVELVRRSAVSK